MSVDPLHITIEDAAKLLAAASNQIVDPEALRRHVAAGAPSHADGTINLVHYAAWVTREILNHHGR